MRALVITDRKSAQVEEVEPPVPGDGQVVVDVRRAGICGTDVELFTGQLAYFAQGKIGFPIRPGHEWCGVVSELGAGCRPGLAGRPGDRRHDARLRALPPLPGRPPARLRGPA